MIVTIFVWREWLRMNSSVRKKRLDSLIDTFRFRIVSTLLWRIFVWGQTLYVWATKCFACTRWAIRTTSPQVCIPMRAMNDFLPTAVIADWVLQLPWACFFRATTSTINISSSKIAMPTLNALKSRRGICTHWRVIAEAIKSMRSGYRSISTWHTLRVWLLFGRTSMFWHGAMTKRNFVRWKMT